VDVYLDMAKNRKLGTDSRFDWSSTVSNPAGDHRRDFTFHVSTSPDARRKFLVSVSNEAPGNPSRGDSLTISKSGPVQVQAHLRNCNGVLSVDMRVIEARGKVLHKWTLSDHSDEIGAKVGGNRYSRLANNEIAKLRIDKVKRVNR
jgi:hypothetical protein